MQVRSNKEELSEWSLPGTHQTGQAMSMLRGRGGESSPALLWSLGTWNVAVVSLATVELQSKFKFHKDYYSYQNADIFLK